MQQPCSNHAATMQQTSSKQTSTRTGRRRGGGGLVGRVVDSERIGAAEEEQLHDGGQGGGRRGGRLQRGVQRNGAVARVERDAASSMLVRCAGLTTSSARAVARPIVGVRGVRGEWGVYVGSWAKKKKKKKKKKG